MDRLINSGIQISSLVKITGLCFLFFTCQPAWSAEGNHSPLIYDIEKLNIIREKVYNHVYPYKNAFESLVARADSLLSTGPFSVVNNGPVPPGGDDHDYSSMSPYWWPDTSRPDGLPYIKRDGVVNPERNAYDKIPFATLGETVEILGLAYYYTGEEKYAGKIREMTRIWFIDVKTKMNPNLTYGQFIPGRTKVRGVGIIESRVLMTIAEAVLLIYDSEAWSSQDHETLVNWYSAYLDWLINSENGIDERKRQNNHGSWYDVQVAYLAVFTGRMDIAEKRIESLMNQRIPVQIEQDGSQPLELARTRSFNYTVFNLSALCTGAEIAKNIDIDLWHYVAEDGKSIRLALDFLIKNAIENGPWPFQQISSPGFSESFLRVLLLACQNYDAARYLNMLNWFSLNKTIKSKEILVTGVEGLEDVLKKKEPADVSPVR